MRILISHASKDEQAASLLRELIERCSLRQIEVWFSSDQSPDGGIKLGDSWFINLLHQLSSTDMIVALITPNSIANPWLYYECGYLANKGKASIVPLTLGLPISAMPMPLSAYQSYDLSVSNSISVFLQKLFCLTKVPYDEDMTRSIRENTSRLLLQVAEATRISSTPTHEVDRNDFEDLRRYLDKRFLELYDSLAMAKLQSRSTESLDALDPMPAELQFTVLRGQNKVKSFLISVGLGNVIQDVLDECYFKMERMVRAYQYLNEWVIRESQTGKMLLSAGRDDDTLATNFFDPTKSYIIELLDKPISLNKSDDE